MINDALTLEIFEALMAQDTINPPGNEKRGALCLKEIFDREGIPCEVQDLGDNRANFIASFGEGDKILEYSGHLDVVPCVGDWQHTAIGTTEEGELIYGRGACDMKGGVAAMNYSISDTAEFGEYVSGPRVLPYEETKKNMKAVLNDIQDGTFAGKWIAENKNGRTFFNSKRAMLAKHPLETVGEKLRNEMLWKDAESGDAGLDAASK